ncbi:Leucine Rich repeat/Leucine Rich Repeat [Novymonas esmeraldas]|uniref:Leucine Rich repeat/Leucine Rich Repeat n=1 Tax=Novymonas esmeraldas TaxID=1808958 RepID=A0AAW0EVF3_9TRYP
MSAGPRAKKEKVPAPGAKGDVSTGFYTRKRWKAVLQETRVDLAGRALGPRGALIVGTALLKNTYVASLDLSHNALGDEGAMAVASMLRVNTQLQHLNLSHNGISDVGGIALASAFIPNVSPTGQPGQWNRTLLGIVLMGNQLGDDTLLAMGNAAACHRDLTRVDLSWNVVGRNGPKCLARAYQRNPLCVYQLGANALGDEGTVYLCEALQRHGGRSQTTLNLYRNDVSSAGAEAVGRLVANSTIVQDVSLAGNTIGFKGAQALQRQLTDAAVVAACTLRTLNLSDNWIGDDGAASVAAIIGADLPSLERLDVSDNRITDVGATAIATAALRNTHLLLLNCEANRLGAKAVEAVVRLIHGTRTLKSLNVAGCIDSADHRRTLTIAVGETDGLHVELGPNPEDAAGAEEDAALVEKMAEHLQMLADQEAQRQKESTITKKKKKSKKVG